MEHEGCHRRTVLSDVRQYDAQPAQAPIVAALVDGLEKQEGWKYVEHKVGVGASGALKLAPMRNVDGEVSENTSRLQVEGLFALTKALTEEPASIERCLRVLWQAARENIVKELQPLKAEVEELGDYSLGGEQRVDPEMPVIALVVGAERQGCRCQEVPRSSTKTRNWSAPWVETGVERNALQDAAVHSGRGSAGGCNDRRV